MPKNGRCSKKNKYKPSCGAHTSMSNESENKNRAKIIEIAKMWPNNRGVNFETTSTMNLLLLIEESIVVN